MYIREYFGVPPSENKVTDYILLTAFKLSSLHSIEAILFFQTNVVGIYVTPIQMDQTR